MNFKIEESVKLSSYKNDNLYVLRSMCIRAEASASQIEELNPYVTINTLTHELDAHTDLQYLTNFTVI